MILVEKPLIVQSGENTFKLRNKSHDYCNIVKDIYIKICNEKLLTSIRNNYSEEKYLKKYHKNILPCYKNKNKFLQNA